MDGAVGERAQAIVQRTERNCPSKVTLLPLLLNSWHLGAVLSPELRPAVRRPDKVGVHSKQELVVWAVRNGLLDEAPAGVDSLPVPEGQ